MRKIASIFIVALLSIGVAKAEAPKPFSRAQTSITPGDLYVSCVRFGNLSHKNFNPKWETATQHKELAPLALRTLAEGCLCIVEEAFKTLPIETIKGYNKYLNGPLLSAAKQANKTINSNADDWMKTFTKDGMVDKEAACNTKAMKADGQDKLTQEVFSEKTSTKTTK